MDRPLDANTRGRLLRAVTYASVSVAATLILVKGAAWFLTGSVSLLASLIDSLMDSLASLIVLFAVRYSLQPADAGHRFGHGKAEPLAGLAQACFICGSALFLLFHAVERLRQPQAVEAMAVGVGVMVFATVLTLLLLLFQRYVIRLTGATAIRADALHYLSDLLSNMLVIFALILGSSGAERADPILAIGVAAYILYCAVKIARDAISQLMDHALPDDVQQRIVAIAMARPEVYGVHELRTRQSGHISFIQLHLELDDNMRLFDAHAVADQVEQDIRQAFPDAQIIVHEDPASLGGAEADAGDGGG